jgi:phosphoribosylformimino-5-aminoimidazole carboxamide ribotide isomerase
MLVIPAVDIKDGKCVRLFQGDYDKVTLFGDDPAEMAKVWYRQGANLLHIVDLDGAKAGRPVNVDSIERIVKEVPRPIEVGGGLRAMPDIYRLLGMGVSRVILGTAAISNRQLVIDACAIFGNRIVVGIDARDGLVAVQGWTETSEVTALDLAKELSAAGVQRFIYTDISRDGAMSGPNYAAMMEMVKATPAKVIASGGVSNKDQLPVLASTGVEGVIIGRALYTGDIKLEEIQEYLA